MIDCSKTENYFKEKARMTKANENNCIINCADCPLSSDNNEDEMLCSSFEMLHPYKAIAIVQKWSNEHPQKTIMQDFLEKFPNAQFGEEGTPNLCPYELGYENLNVYTAEEHICEKYNCVECWNRPLSEVEQ